MLRKYGWVFFLYRNTNVGWNHNHKSSDWIWKREEKKITINRNISSDKVTVSNRQTFRQKFRTHHQHLPFTTIHMQQHRQKKSGANRRKHVGCGGSVYGKYSIWTFIVDVESKFQISVDSILSTSYLLVIKPETKKKMCGYGLSLTMNVFPLVRFSMQPNFLMPIWISNLCVFISTGYRSESLRKDRLTINNFVFCCCLIDCPPICLLIDRNSGYTHNSN